MAKCPNCNYKLRLIDVKAECPVCGVNIPNFNWEERLEEDAANAERSFSGFRRRTAAVKNSLFGTRMRTARFVLTFAPLLFFLFPMITYKANLPFLGEKENISMLSLILDIVNGKLDIGAMINFMSFEKSGVAFVLLYVALGLVLAGIVTGVLNFLFIILNSFGYKATSNVVLCAMSLVTFAAAAVCVVVSSSMIASVIPEMLEIKLSYSLFIGMAFFTVNLVLNSITAKQFRPLRKELLEGELEDTIRYQEEMKAI